MMAAMTAITGFQEKLAQRVPAQSLAVFRILFGALILVDFWRFIKHDRIWRYWIEPDFHFSYPFFHWLPRFDGTTVTLLWLSLGVSALLVTIGLFYRVAIGVMTLTFAYFFLFDAAEYLNHFYLVLLYALLLCVLPAARIWSVDHWWRQRRGRTGPEDVPYAAVFALRAQTEVMLIFAGLVKLTPDWLAGEPLGLWLRGQAGGKWFEVLVMQDWIIIAACWAVIALHVLGAPLLLWSRTRLAVFLTYGCFHIANSFFFNIGIFPWLTIAASTIFFAPDWPMQLWHRLTGRGPTERGRTERGQAASVVTSSADNPLPRIALVALAVWLAVQIALPLRAGAFESEVRWSGEGHRLSWRMRIYDREAEGVFILTDRETGAEWRVYPEAFLSRRQAGKMLVRADMVHQFAAYLADLWEEAGHDVAVRAEICKSLNGRPCQMFVDPGVDLTQVSVNPFRSDTWILPLTEPAWGVRDNG